MAWETRILKTVNSQSVANNTSNITFTFQARRTDYSVSGYNNYGTAYWRISVDGASSGNVYFNINWKYGQNVWFTIASWTVTVTHNNSGYWGSNVNAYVSTGISPRELSAFEWFSPPNIARKTTVYGFTNTMGNIQGFELNRKSSSFTHRLRYEFGSASGTIGTGLGTTAEWNIPLSLANQVTSTTQGTGRVYLDTYNGSTLVGTDSATFTLNVPSSVQPSISGISVSDIGASKNLGIYVQGISRLQLTAHASGSYGSWINSAKIVVDGQTIWSTSGTTANIRGSGNMTITATVTDSRGRSASRNMTISVQPYSSPSLSGYSATRQNPQSNVQVVSSGRVSSLTSGGTQKNSLAYRIKYKQKSSSSWETKTVSVSGLSFSNNAQTLSNIDITKSYDFQLSIADYFSETVYNLSVSTAKVILDVAKNGIGINKYYESGALDVNGNANVSGSVMINSGLTVTGTGQFGGGFYTSSRAGARTSSVIFVPVVPYSVIEPTHDTAKYFKEWLKWVCANYYGKGNTIFIGATNPNAQGWAIAHIYDTTDRNAEGLPRYSSGLYNPVSGNLFNFYTYNFSYGSTYIARLNDIYPEVRYALKASDAIEISMAPGTNATYSQLKGGYIYLCKISGNNYACGFVFGDGDWGFIGWDEYGLFIKIKKDTGYIETSSYLTNPNVRLLYVRKIIVA